MIRLVLAAVLAAMLAVPQSSPRPARAVVFTYDDLPWVSRVAPSHASMEQGTRALLAGLRRHQVPAIGFVNEDKLAPGGAIDDRRVGLLRMWVEQGFELGNHTYSHPDLNTTAVEVYQADILRGEAMTTKVAGKRPRFFRHPFLHAGRTLEAKGAVEAFLATHGYRVAPVTIDNYDYIFARAYDLADAAGRPRIAAAYLEYMTAVVAFYEQQSVAIVGREIPQVLLLHANPLNAATVDGLAEMFKGRGYTFVTLDRALQDPAYQLPDTYAGPAGITWLHRWAITAGKPASIFRGEPVVPSWIERAAAAR